MHLFMIFLALTIACIVRYIPLDKSASWESRWQRSLFLFLFPPLIVIMTALAIVFMGAEGQMLGLHSSWLSYSLSICLIVIPSWFLIKLSFQAWRCCKQITTYPQYNLQGNNAYLIDLDFPYIAQIGFWQPKLVVTKGLLEILDLEQLEAVLAHEKAHVINRDTFCFFWLGWLRSFTQWLPNTETIWQELLLLREIRADLKAINTVDALTLAESLLTVARAAITTPTPCFATPLFTDDLGFSEIAKGEALQEQNSISQRIEAMIDTSASYQNNLSWRWLWIFLLLIPWATIPLHS